VMFQRPDRVRGRSGGRAALYVVCPIFNPMRWWSRWDLYADFRKRVGEAGAVLVTVEAAFGEREFVVTDPSNPLDVQVRTRSELWLKENLINIGLSRLPADAEYVAWVDADVRFARDDWADETVHQLQHYAFVQMWSQFQDLTPDNELVGVARSFMGCRLGGHQSSVIAGKQPPSYTGPDKPNRGYPGATGLAWAARREALDAVGGLIDFSILGACDWYMAHALVGALGTVAKKEWTDAHLAQMLVWQDRAERHVRRNVGVVKGLALHYWHGPKAQRKYRTRDNILVQHGFDPLVDLKKDVQGLYQLTTQKPGLRDAIMEYFRERNEDALS
jgi:hypothetical protein